MNSNPSNSTASRFRKGGLSKTVCAATGAAAIMTVNAAPIYSGVQNITVVDGGPTVSVNLDGKGVEEFTLFFLSQKAVTTALDNFTYVGPGSSYPDRLPAGITISSATQFSANTFSILASPNAPSTGWRVAGDDGYLGFRFNPSGNLNLYGWAHVVLTSSSSLTIVDWAYDNAGNPISTSAVPEPSAWTLLGLGLAGLAYHRRRRAAPA